MAPSTQWQLTREAAQRYDDILVPVILGPFARIVLDRANLKDGETVLDVGCGTGVAARQAAQQVGPGGKVIAADLNEGMLEVARSIPSAPGAAIEWHRADATQLPVGDGSVDVVLCTQVLQFVPDRGKAVAEMHRVLRLGGRAVLSVWGPLPENPYFEAVVGSVSRHIGPDAAISLRAPFTLGNPDEIRALLRDAGFREVHVDTAQLELPLPDPTEYVPRHLSATPMADVFDAAMVASRKAIVREVSDRLAACRTGKEFRVRFRSRLALAEK